MKVGDVAPDFELESGTGERIRLSSFLGRKQVVMFFYVRDGTSGCTAEVNGIKEQYGAISDRYEVFGINDGTKESHQKFCQRNNLPFKILADPGKKVASLYHARGALGTYTKRITYLIGLDGRIKEIVGGMGASNHVEFVQGLVPHGA